MNARVSWYLIEELTWAIDKWVQVMSNTMLFKTVSYTTKSLRNIAIQPF